MRTKIIAGNWKMNGSRTSSLKLLRELKEGAENLIQPKTTPTMVVFPGFVHLHITEQELVDSLIAWGGQNVFIGQSGAFTGEISGSMLTDYGCQYVLIGHSERRILLNEDSMLIAEKMFYAIESGLQPVLCVGETDSQRDEQRMETTLKEQLGSVVKRVGVDRLRQAVIAYEPLWAIGSGISATPQQVQTAHEFIRGFLGQHDATLADNMRIIYGGSVKPDNAAAIFAMPDVDGALVGGASLDAKDFLAIYQAAL